MILMLKSLFINICYFSHTFKSFYIFIPVLGIAHIGVQLASIYERSTRDTAMKIDVLREEVQLFKTEFSVSICVKATDK
jgi:hypothetical protein